MSRSTSRLGLRPDPTTRLSLSTVGHAVLLTVSATALWFFAIAFVASVIEEFTREPSFSGQQHNFTFGKDGQPVWKTTWYRRGNIERMEYHDLDGQPVEMTTQDENVEQHGLSDVRIERHPKRAAWKNGVRFLNEAERTDWYFEDFGSRGQFALFDTAKHHRIGFVGTHGFSREPPPVEQQFPMRDGDERATLIPNGATALTRAGFGVYMQQTFYGNDLLLLEPGGRRMHWIDRHERTCRVIHDGEPVLAACFELRHARSRFVLRTEDSLKVVGHSNTTVDLVEVLRLPERVRRLALFSWIRTPDGPLFVEPLFNNGWNLIWATRDGEVLRGRHVPSRYEREEPSHAWVAPLIQVPVIGEFMAWAVTHPDESESSDIDYRRAKQLGLELARQRPDIDAKWFVAPLIALHLSVAFWSVLAVRRLRRCGASLGEQVFWTAWTLAFGLPGYLAFRVHREWRPHRAGIATGLAPVVQRILHYWQSFKNRVVQNPASHWGKPSGGALSRGVALLACAGLSPRHAALVLKELRSVAFIGALAGAAYLLVVAKLTNVTGFLWMRTFVSQHSSATVPFLHDGFAEPFSTVTLLLAVCLAVWQTTTESRGGAWLFLLHRPVSRRAILCSKLAVGLSVLLVCSALPIVLYGTWAARPGTHPSPFEWSMTTETWRLWWSMPPLYLGTLLAMWRPARWLGTRALPCVAGFAWLMTREVLGVWLWPTWQEFAAVAVVDAVFVACLLLIVREREYP